MDDTKLIEAIRVRPSLYNRKDTMYTNRDYAASLWEQVAFEVNGNERTEIVKRRWSYIRDYYRKQKKLLMSGIGKKKKKWCLQDSLNFLDPSMEYPLHDYNNHLDYSVVLPEEEDDDEEASSNSADVTRNQDHFEDVLEFKRSPSQQDLDLSVNEGNTMVVDPITNSVSETSKRSKRKRSKEGYSKLDLQIMESLKGPDPEDDPDGHVHFWKGLVPMIKKLEPLQAMKFKHEVQGLLINYVERSSKT